MAKIKKFLSKNIWVTAILSVALVSWGVNAFASTLVSRLYNFETDRINGVKITASRIDGEFDQIITALNRKVLSAASAPANPINGQTWVDTTNNVLKVYLNNAWVTVYADDATGVMKMYAGSSAPTGWLKCDGSAVSRTTYADLFAVIGTTYGAGDTTTTFNLPEFDDRFPRGNTLAASGGSDTHAHTGGAHTHTVSATVDGETADEYDGGNSITVGRDGAISGTAASGGEVATSTEDNIPAFTGVMFIIKT